MDVKRSLTSIMGRADCKSASISVSECPFGTFRRAIGNRIIENIDFLTGYVLYVSMCFHFQTINSIFGVWMCRSARTHPASRIV